MVVADRGQVYKILNAAFGQLVISSSNIKPERPQNMTARILHVNLVQFVQSSVCFRRKARNGEGPIPLGDWAFVVPRERLELSTSALPRMRSTTELTRPGTVTARNVSEAAAIAKVFEKTKRKMRRVA